MLNAEGYVAECTGDNVFIVRQGTLVTPPTHVGALEGITRNTVIDLARDMRIRCVEEMFTPAEMYTADEAFLTGTAAEVIPVSSLDGRPIGKGKPGPITVKLMKNFHRLTRSKRTSR